MTVAEAALVGPMPEKSLSVIHKHAQASHRGASDRRERGVEVSRGALALKAREHAGLPHICWRGWESESTQSKQILRSARAGKRRVGVAFGMVVLMVICMFNT